MYEPFPGNYVWNLSINICLAMGGVMGEIDPANDKVRAIAERGEDRGTEAFFDAWGALGDRLVNLGSTCEAEGRARSASQKYLRAAAYYITAERMQSRDFAPRRTMYAQMLKTFQRAVKAGGLACEHVEIRYGDASFPALFVPGRGQGPRPCMVFCNGLDSVKEMIFLCVREEFADRGISVLMVDQPGVGEALRLRGLTAIPDSERWAGAAVDYLETRRDVDGKKIGMIGWSLGGYFSPRAACYERRFALCVAWGANHNWGELQRRRLLREGERPVPHYWDHVKWVWGHSDMESFMAMMLEVTLEGHLARLHIPFLVTHGANDRQIPVEYAHKTRDQAVNSPRVDLHIFGADEGGIEHVSCDNMEPALSYIADWVSDRFAELC